MKAMPDEGIRKPLLYVKKALPSEFPVMEMAPIDFLGWAHAHVRNYRNMVESCKHSKWPESKSHPFNRLLKLPEQFEEDPEHYLDEAS